MAQDITPAGSFYPAYAARPQEETLGWNATKQLFFVIFKWRRLILSLFLIFTLAAAVAMFLKPSVRAASAKIMLKGDRMPLMMTGLTNFSSRYSPQVMQTEVQMIKSRQVLLPVAKKLLSRSGNRERDPTAGEIEAVIDWLSQSTVAVAVPDTNVIQLNYFARTSEEAERNLRLITEEYLEQQAELQSGSGKLLKFYEQEKERVGGQLQELEEQLKQWQEQNNTVSIDKQISDQLGTLTQREQALGQTDAEIESAKARVAVMKSQLSPLPERLVMNREQVKNPLVAKLKGDLLAAELVLQDLLQRYTEKDRRVQEKREVIALLKRELASAEKESVIVGAETTGLNPLRESLERELAGAQALLSSLTSRREILRKQVGEISAGLPAMRDKGVEVDRRSRAVALHKETFQLYGRKLEEARIATGIGKEQLGQVAVIEQSHAIPVTDFQKRVGMVILAAFVGLALGMAIAFGFEFFNDSLRTPADVEHYLGLPALAAIPDLRKRPLALES